MSKLVLPGEILICKKCGWIGADLEPPKECEKCKGLEFWLIEEFAAGRQFAETWRP